MAAESYFDEALREWETIDESSRKCWMPPASVADPAARERYKSLLADRDTWRRRWIESYEKLHLIESQLAPQDLVDWIDYISETLQPRRAARVMLGDEKDFYPLVSAASRIADRISEDHPAVPLVNEVPVSYDDAELSLARLRAWAVAVARL
jgi:hypothetical protein